jgi:hypothetical protein
LLNEPSKMAAEFSPGRKPGDHVSIKINKPAKRATELSVAPLRALKLLGN